MASFAKRKIVIDEILNDYTLPEGEEIIGKVLRSNGNNLHEVLDEHREEYLVSMPTKFRKKIWIKRGDYVVLRPIEEGQKVKAEITKILYKDQIRYIRDQGRWPSTFDQIPIEDTENLEANTDELKLDETQSENSGSESDSDSGLFQNPNRPKVTYEESSESDDSDDRSSSEGE